MWQLRYILKENPIGKYLPYSELYRKSLFSKIFPRKFFGILLMGITLVSEQGVTTMYYSWALWFIHPFFGLNCAISLVEIFINLFFIQWLNVRFIFFSCVSKHERSMLTLWNVWFFFFFTIIKLKYMPKYRNSFKFNLIIPSIINSYIITSL